MQSVNVTMPRYRSDPIPDLLFELELPPERSDFEIEKTIHRDDAIADTIQSAAMLAQS
jgi:hypothetical protein